MVKKICDALITLILVGLLVLAGMLFVPSIMGYQSFAVVSGSMEPNIPVGSIVYAKPVEYEQLKVGDIISYRLSETTMVTHRINEIEQTTHSFITKGDANDSVDGSPVPYENVVGKVVMSIPYIGYITVYARTPLGITAVCGIVAVMIVLNFLPELIPSKSNKDQEVAK